MGSLVLHVLHAEASADWGTLRLAHPEGAPDERVLLWDGLPPVPVPAHPSLPDLALWGDLDGRGVYAEVVPVGVYWSQAEPPPALRAYVVWRVLEALAVLHRAFQVHGRVGPDRVLLGVDGEVVLVGRGRASAMARMDVLGAMDLLAEREEVSLSGSAAVIAQELGLRCDSGQREALAAWVRSVLPEAPDGPQGSVEVLLSGDHELGADEILPDLGTDTGGEGLLDRWMATTGITLGETTAEVTDAGQRFTSDALALWSLLVSTSEQRPPESRFDAARGRPSPGIQRLLSAERPASLPDGGHAESAPPQPQSDRQGALAEDSVPLSAPQDPRRGWVELALLAIALSALLWLVLSLAGRL